MNFDQVATAIKAGPGSVLKVSLPKKGHLQKETGRIIDAAGFKLWARNAETGDWVSWDHKKSNDSDAPDNRVDVVLIEDTSGDMGFFCGFMERSKDGIQDTAIGWRDIQITGRDVQIDFELAASGVDLRPKIVMPLNFSRCDMHLLSRTAGDISANDFDDMRDVNDRLIVATSYEAAAHAWFTARKIENVHIIKRDGGIEAYANGSILPPTVACVVDLVDTGTSAKQNGLYKNQTLFPSYACVVMRPGEIPETVEDQARTFIKRIADAASEICTATQFENKELEPFYGAGVIHPLQQSKPVRAVA